MEEVKTYNLNFIEVYLLLNYCRHNIVTDIATMNNQYINCHKSNRSTQGTK